MSCCSPREWEPDEKPNGICKGCGEDTVDGDAYVCCSYSPVECEECGYAPCDLSC